MTNHNLEPLEVDDLESTNMMKKERRVHTILEKDWQFERVGINMEKKAKLEYMLAQVCTL